MVNAAELDPALITVNLQEKCQFSSLLLRSSTQHSAVKQTSEVNIMVRIRWHREAPLIFTLYRCFHHPENVCV